MNRFNKKIKYLAISVLSSISYMAISGEILFYTPLSDPNTKPAAEELVRNFEAEHPNIKVNVNYMAGEGYKTSIRNFLSANAPDVAGWFPGNRMIPYIEAGLFEPIDDVWSENGLDEPFKAAAGALTYEGHKWGVPFTYYNYGIYYRKDIFEKYGIDVPKNWEEFIAAGEKLKAEGIIPLTVGSKALWAIAAYFDYLNARTHGYDFHMALTRGEIPWTDPRVKETMMKWKELVDKGFFTKNHTSLTYEDALPSMVNGESAMILMGNFIVGSLRSGGLKDEQIGFFTFPEITAGVPRVEDAPMDMMFIPKNAKNKEDAKKFMAYLARPDVQYTLNSGLKQIPVNAKSELPSDPYLRTGFETLSSASNLMQFFDRDTDAEMANIAMQGFQEFMVNPDRLDTILERIEKARVKIHGNK